MPKKSLKQREVIVLPSNKQNEVKNRPGRIDREARFSVVNNRMFICTVLMGLITLFAVYGQHKASVRADNSIKTAWVKMYPNGTWDIDFNDEHRQPEFFQSTIDYMLRSFCERRYSKIPHSVNADYGFVYVFMSPPLQSDFVNSNGYDAPAKAAQIADCPNCQVTKIKVRTIDHYDRDKTRFGNIDGTLYRSNIFATREIRDAEGRLNTSENIIIPIQWRIKSQEEIQADKELLKTNPIGLEVMEYSLLKDSSKSRGRGES